MGAAQHQRIRRRSAAEQRPEIVFRRRLGGGQVRPAFLGQRHEHLAGLLHDLGVCHQLADGARIGAASDRALGGDHGDAAIARGGDAGPRAGLDHADHRNVLPGLLQEIERHRRGRVAGDHQHLYALVEQQPRRLQRVGLHRLGALGAVRQPRRVAEIDEAFAGKPRHQCAQYRQPAHAGVEDPDRPGITRHRLHRRW